MTGGNLLSIGQLCNNGYEVIFTKNMIKFVGKNNEIQFNGTRDTNNGMWTVHFPQQRANIILQYKPIRDAIKCMHAACSSPYISTLCKAIDIGLFHFWPVLTSKRVRQFIKQNSIATAQGQLTQVQQYLPSKIVTNNVIQNKHDAYVKIELAKSTDAYTYKTYSDLTDRFPQRSSRGNQYIFIL